MKITLFNKKAPALISHFSNMMDKIVDGQIDGLNVSDSKKSVENALAAMKDVGCSLNGIGISKLKALRSNAAAGNAYFTAVDNHQSLSNILSVTSNMLNEMEEEDASIDDIMGAGEDEDAENGGYKKPANEGDEDEDLGELDDLGDNGDGEDLGDEDLGDDDLGDNGDELDDDMLNFGAKVSKPNVKKPKNHANSTGSVDLNFLV